MDDPKALRRRATLALFASFVLFLPAPFYFVFIAGLIPLAVTTTFFVAMLAVSVAQSPGAGLVGLLVLAVHVTIGGALLYLIASSVCRLLFRICTARWANRAVGLVIAGELALSFFPIYLLPDEQPHWRFESLSLWSLLGRYLFPG